MHTGAGKMFEKIMRGTNAPGKILE